MPRIRQLWAVADSCWVQHALVVASSQVRQTSARSKYSERKLTNIIRVISHDWTQRTRSRVQKLSESRRCNTLAPLLNSFVTVQTLGNGHDMLSMPESYWDEVIKEWARWNVPSEFWSILRVRKHEYYNYDSTRCILWSELLYYMKSKL